MKHASFLALALALSSFLPGCGATDDGPGEGTAPTGTGDPNNPPPVSTGDPNNPPPVSTGNPNDPPPVGQGPCNINSGYPGDELCILPPAPEEGIQIHAGPADYDDPDAVAPFLVGPGEENVKCYLATVPEGGFHYLRQQNRMRSGSHHMLIDLQPATSAGACSFTSRMGTIPGSQTPSRDYPSELGPEDQGLARFLPADTAAAFQLHYVNTTNGTLLREAWVNIYKKPESEVTQRLHAVFLVGDVRANIPAHTRATTKLAFTPTLTEPTRIFQLNGHSHAHSETFTVYRTRGTDKELIYKSYDWSEPDELTYNTVVQNSPPDDVAKADGGSSGLFYMEPGDGFEWECDVNNTTDAALHFANEAYTAEMCLLAGGYVSETPGLMSGGCTVGGCIGGIF